MTDYAKALAAARRSGDVAPEPPAGLDLAGGYALADAAFGARALSGWKVGATNAGAQAFLKIDAPIRGRIFDDGIWMPGNVGVPGARDAEAEPEIVLRAGPHGRPVAAYLGIEVVRPSRDDALTLGAPFIVADNAAHCGLVLGPEIPLAALDRPDDIAVTLFRNGVETGAGTAAAVLGDPRCAYDWLAGMVDLKPGQFVATGAITRAARFAVGDEIVADFGALGRVRIVRTEVMPADGE
jgi:2-keto-4-pentenoate hydratase